MKSKITIAIAILTLSIFLFGFRQEMNLVGAINNARARYGRCAVVENQALNEFAQYRLSKLNLDNYNSFHTDREGYIQDCNNFRQSTGYAGKLGEIIAKNPLPEIGYGYNYVNVWMRSRYHRAVIIERQYRLVGFAVELKDGWCFVVVEFMTGGI
jgi:uncharacterized protein YkwD